MAIGVVMWLTIYAIGFLIVLIWQYHDINKTNRMITGLHGFALGFGPWRLSF